MSRTKRRATPDPQLDRSEGLSEPLAQLEGGSKPALQFLPSSRGPSSISISAGVRRQHEGSHLVDEAGVECRRLAGGGRAGSAGVMGLQDAWEVGRPVHPGRAQWRERHGATPVHSRPRGRHPLQILPIRSATCRHVIVGRKMAQKGGSEDDSPRLGGQPKPALNWAFALLRGWDSNPQPTD